MAIIPLSGQARISLDDAVYPIIWQFDQVKATAAEPDDSVRLKLEIRMHVEGLDAYVSGENTLHYFSDSEEKRYRTLRSGLKVQGQTIEFIRAISKTLFECLTDLCAEEYVDGVMAQFPALDVHGEPVPGTSDSWKGRWAQPSVKSSGRSLWAPGPLDPTVLDNIRLTGDTKDMHTNKAYNHLDVLGGIEMKTFVPKGSK